MYTVAALNIAGVIIASLALIYIYKNRDHPFLGHARHILALMLLCMLFISISNALEYLRVTDQFDHFEDYFSIMIPLLFGGFIFSVHQNVVKQELLQSRKMQELALDGANLGTWSWNVETGEASFDSRWADILGYDLAELGPRSDIWWKFVHPEDKPRVDRILGAHLRGKTDAFEVEQRMLSKSGKWKWVLDRGKVIKRNPEGKPLMMAGTLLDINESKVIRERLNSTENIYHTVFENSGTALAIMDQDAGISMVNDELCRLVGRSRDQIEGRVDWGSFLSEQNLDRLKRDNRQHLLDSVPVPHQYEFELKDAEGKLKNILFNAAVIPNTQKTLVSISDITKLKRSEKKRLEMERGVQYAQKLESLGVMASGIAHDFNNLLMAIQGNAEMITGEYADDSEAHECADEIIKASRRAAEICRQMLAYSGDQHFVVEDIDINDEIRKISKMLEMSIANNAVLRYELGEKIPTISADIMQLRQIMLNLVTNASEAVEEDSGYITITTGARNCSASDLRSKYINDDLPPGEYVYFQVSDTGTGMDEETQQKVFDPFYTSKFPGRGLGMPTVLGLVKGHNGSVEIQSETGEGTTVTVLLPAGELKIAGPQEEPAKEEESQDRQEWKGKLLIVDDETGVLNIAKKILTNLGVEVLTATDGKKAIESFSSNPDIDGVILDLSMPHMGGEKTFEKLKELKKELPIVISSGYSTESVEEEFKGKDVAGLIHKPFHRSDLSEALNQILEA